MPPVQPSHMGGGCDLRSVPFRRGRVVSVHMQHNPARGDANVTVSAHAADVIYITCSSRDMQETYVVGPVDRAELNDWLAHLCQVCDYHPSVAP